MTKFGHYLASLNRDCPAEHRDAFIAYKLLKKLIRQCQQREGEQCQARFFGELQAQLDAANRHFAASAGKIINSYHRQRQPRCCFLPPRRTTPQQKQELAQRAYWCRKYAKANAVALRKILKKHDKCCHSTAGRQFLQECWRSEAGSGVGLFLHSPLLDELKAIQDVLQAQVPAEDPDLVERAPAPPLPAKPGFQAAAAGAAAAGAPQQQQAQQEEAEEGGQLALGALPITPGLSIKTRAAVEGGLSAALRRASLDGAGSQAGSDSCWASPAGSVDCGLSYTSPSLRHQRQQALSAIVESPTCMLDTGDFEWCPTGSPDAAAAPVSHTAPGAAAAGADAHGGAAPEALLCQPGSFREEDLKCPICLEVLYKPVGLSCGHKFCRGCALEAAGFGRAIGAFHNIASHIPRRVGCPQCRQAGVYRHAVVLREVGNLIQSRYPEEWAERRAEERARNKALVTSLGERQRQVMHSRNAFELLFTM